MGLFLMVILGACSSLPKPGSGLVEESGMGEGSEWVRRAVEVEGDAWSKAERVEMRFSGMSQKRIRDLIRYSGSMVAPSLPIRTYR